MILIMLVGFRYRHILARLIQNFKKPNYAECCYSECRYSESRPAECHYSERRYVSVVAPDATWQQKLATDISQFALKVASSLLDLPCHSTGPRGPML